MKIELTSQTLTPEIVKSFTFADLVSIYGALRPMASNLMRRERKGHSLHTTALMHEALERLMGKDWEAQAWQNPGHFVEAYCRNMRYVLVDHARRKTSAKRGGKFRRVAFNDALQMYAVCPQQILDISDLLEKLATCPTLVEPVRKAKVVNRRIFGNLSEVEIADELEVSPATVRRDWQQAKAWLALELSKLREET